MTLAELKIKYRLGVAAKYEPNPECKFCKGTGERPVKAVPSVSFCGCLYVHPSVSNELLQGLADTAMKLLRESRARQ